MIEVEVLEDIGRNAPSFPDETQENVLCPDVLMVQSPCLLIGKLHHLAGAVGETLVHGGKHQLYFSGRSTKARHDCTVYRLYSELPRLGGCTAARKGLCSQARERGTRGAPEHGRLCDFGRPNSVWDAVTGYDSAAGRGAFELNFGFRISVRIIRPDPHRVVNNDCARLPQAEEENPRGQG